MDVYVNFRGNVTEEDSYHLNQLANLVEKDCDLPVQMNKKDLQKGVKDGGLTIGLAIASLGLSAIGTLISVLSYWRSQQPKYSITVTRGDAQFVIDNMNQKQLQSVISQLEVKHSSASISVLVSGE